MNEFLAEWGYLAVYVATTLEGEFAYLSAIVAGTLGQIKIGGYKHFGIHLIDSRVNP